MPITIPDRTKIKLTTVDRDPDNGQRIPCVARVAMTNPGPVTVATQGLNAAGQIQVEPAAGDAGREGYLGYNIVPNVPAGGVPGVFRGVIVEGFAGATPGAAVFVDATTADASGSASGLTETAPATGDNRARVGVALSATKIRFD